MVEHDILIVGSGVAGSTLAREVSGKGYRVTVVDWSRRYSKACGDAIALRPGLREQLEKLGVIVTVVRSFEIRVHGNPVYEETFRRPKWVIVDKPRLVEALREEAIAGGVKFVKGAWRGERGTVTVDARGPYASKPGNRVFVYRSIARARWDPERALLDFDLKSKGFYWVFPASPEGKLVNIGLGLESVNNARILRSLVESYSRKVLGSFEPVDEKGAPVTVKGPVVLREGDLIKVGEAAGLVVSTAGEGNRPAIMSAKALARAIESGFPDIELIEAKYKAGVSRLVGEVLLSRRLLRIMEGA
ncbi:MAG: NAD(P)/FAD-dependent oxidoreductase, partial [Desulfurococcales archaeon]|nr:NAD(P)/FAD-dependent oxidoreductase [Desulfurococcales archaeon]